MYEVRNHGIYWELIMNRFFRGYILTNNKHPIQKFTDGAELLKYDEVKDAQEYAGVLAPDAVLVDIDDKEQANVLADIVEEMQLNCQMRETDRGIHFYFINKRCAHSFSRFVQES